MKTQRMHLITVTMLISLIIISSLAGSPLLHVQQAEAAATGISDMDSCLSLPAKAKAKWDEQERRCAIQGKLEVMAGEVIDVAPGTTLAIEQKGRAANGGAISVSPGSALVVAGRLANGAGGTLANSGNVTNLGALVNKGIIASSADASVKNAGRLSNQGIVVNGAGAMLSNLGRMANSEGGVISNAGLVDNRGIMSLMQGAMIAGGSGGMAAGAGMFENSGRLVLYCDARVAVEVSGAQAIDRCDDPPAAEMYAFIPAESGGDGESAFTFYASATDDRRLAHLEWDFDGDGGADRQQEVPPPGGRTADVWIAHSYDKEGVYRPQVRAVDSAGARSAWDAYGEHGQELDVVVSADIKMQKQEQEQQPAGINNNNSNSTKPVPKIAAGAATPVADGIEVSGKQGLPIQILLNATDADGDELTFQVLSEPQHGSLVGVAPELTYLPDGEYLGKDSFTFTASDGTRKSEPATVQITIVPPSPSPPNVNGTAPIVDDEAEKKAEKEDDIDEDKINNDNNAAPAQPPQQPGNNNNNTSPVAEEQAVMTSAGAPVEVWLSAFDLDGDVLQFQVTSEPQHGRLSGSAPALTYTPDAGYQGEDSFVFSVADGSGKSSTATVAITVKSGGGNESNNNPPPSANNKDNVNVPPIVAVDDAATAAQDRQVLISVLSNDANSSGAHVSSVASPENGSAAVTGGTSVTYTPNPGFAGTDAFTYTATDSGGNTATAMVMVTVVAAAAANPTPPPAEVPAPSPPAPPQQQQPAQQEPVPEPTQQPEPAPPQQQPPPAAPIEDDETLYCGREMSSFASVVNGTAGNDELAGAEGDDLILGHGGDDILNGMGGSDCVVGGEGNDAMWGGEGDDEMHGGPGDDKAIIGDAGADLLYGGEGSDLMWGGEGDDRLFAGPAGDGLVGDAGNDRLNGEEGDDTIYDDEGDDSIDGGDGDGDRCWDGAGAARIANCEGQ